MISPPMRALAIFKNALGTVGDAFCMHCCVTLRQIFIMPSVAMNGGMPKCATRTPVHSPSSTPSRIPMAMAMIYAGIPVIPRPASRPAGPLSISDMTTAPIATIVEPTARSMPPEMMTNVMPSATMPTPALLRRMLIQFRENAANHSPKDA